MKKSRFKAIPIRNIIATLAFSLLNFSCTQQAKYKDLGGSFSGTDGSNKVPSQANCTIAITGDGLISGLWNSTGTVTKAQLAGKVGTFKNELTLYVQTGVCQGQFHGEFSYENGEFKGVLKDNPNCPDQLYHFDLKKSS